MRWLPAFLGVLLGSVPLARAQGDDPVLAAHLEERPVTTVFGALGYASALADGDEPEDRTTLGNTAPIAVGGSVGWLLNQRLALVAQGVAGGADLPDRQIAFASALVGARAWLGRAFAEWTLGAGVGWSSERGITPVDVFALGGALGVDVVRSSGRAYHLALRVDASGGGDLDEEGRVHAFFPSLQLGVTWY